MLTVIDDARTIERCHTQLRRAVVARAGRGRTHEIGFPGGRTDLRLHYVPKLNFWIGFGAVENRFFIPCGRGNPFAEVTPAPSLEVNIPYEGIDRRIAGAFLRDERGNIYLGHSGRVGGGARGVSRSNFMKEYPDHTQVKSGGRPFAMYILGRLDSDDLVDRIAEHAARSATFRAKMRDQRADTGSDPKLEKQLGFSPEFEGTLTYDTLDRITADRKHGTVVRALRDYMARSGLKPANNQQRDLYVKNAKDRLTGLFEVKTDVDTQSLYTCVGQLMYHGGADAPTLVAVLPDRLPSSARRRLRDLGVHVVTYRWQAKRPAFQGMGPVLRRLSR